MVTWALRARSVSSSITSVCSPSRKKRESTWIGDIQKHLESEGFEVTGAEFTRIPNDLKDVTAEQRETIDKMVEKLEDFDDVQTVYTNMKPEE